LAFEPDIIEITSAAFVAACEDLHLKIGDDPAARFVAEKVIELARRGTRRSGYASQNDAERIWFERCECLGCVTINASFAGTNESAKRELAFRRR
jgi:hypothetical protein